MARYSESEWRGLPDSSVKGKKKKPFLHDGKQPLGNVQKTSGKQVENRKHNGNRIDKPGIYLGTDGTRYEYRKIVDAKGNSHEQFNNLEFNHD